MRVKKIIRTWIPLVASFIESKPIHRKDAAMELGLVLLLSTIPIWGGGILAVALREPETIDYFNAMYQLVSNGELILFSTSILAPIFYLVLHEPRGERSYPDRFFQGSIILVLLIVSLLLFSAQRQSPNPDYIFKWSISIFVASVALLYLATVFRNWMNDNPDFKQSEREFLENYTQRRS